MQPAENREGRIKHGKSWYQEGEEYDCGRGCRADRSEKIESQEGNHETEQRAARISHEDFGGGKIREEESGARAEKAPCDRSAESCFHSGGECDVAQGDNARDARCQPVGTVQEIVRNYLFRVFDKLGVSTRVELVLYCLQARQRDVLGEAKKSEPAILSFKRKSPQSNPAS